MKASKCQFCRRHYGNPIRLTRVKTRQGSRYGLFATGTSCRRPRCKLIPSVHAGLRLSGPQPVAPPLQARRSRPLQRRARPAMLARRQVGRLRRVADRREGGPRRQLPHLDDQLRRQERSSRSPTANESESAPRWSPDGKYLSFTSSRPGTATRQPGVAPPPSRRRSHAAHRRKRPLAELRMVARFEAPRAGDRRSRSR